MSGKISRGLKYEETQAQLTTDRMMEELEEKTLMILYAIALFDHSSRSKENREKLEGSVAQLVEFHKRRFSLIVPDPRYDEEYVLIGTEENL